LPGECDDLYTQVSVPNRGLIRSACLLHMQQRRHYMAAHSLKLSSLWSLWLLIAASLNVYNKVEILSS